MRNLPPPPAPGLIIEDWINNSWKEPDVKPSYVPVKSFLSLEERKRLDEIPGRIGFLQAEIRDVLAQEDKPLSQTDQAVRENRR